MSPAGSISSDAPPSIEISSSSTYYCVSPDITERYLAGAILKPGGGSVFVYDGSLLPICHDLIAMVTVSLSLTCACT